MCMVAIAVVTIVPSLLTSNQTSLVAVFRGSRLPLFDGAEKVVGVEKGCFC